MYSSITVMTNSINVITKYCSVAAMTYNITVITNTAVLLLLHTQ